MFSTRGITKNKRIYILARSDRINALRKQYDAFLEEDKKRKERNEFILGKLDKMRYNSALVPLRHKFQPSKFVNRPDVVDRLGHPLEISPVRDLQPPTLSQNQLIPNTPINNIEETYLIQEISKKYILIPKVRSSFTSNYIRNETPKQNTETLQMRSGQDTIPINDFNPTSSENTDWKSKYEILNILKKEENEKPGNCSTNVVALPDHSVHADSVLANEHEPNITAHYDNHVNAGLIDYASVNGVDQFPERDLPTDSINYEFSNDNEYIQNTNVVANLVQNASREFNEDVEPHHDQTGATGYELQNMACNSSVANDIEIPEEHTNYLAQSVSNANVTSANVNVPSDQRCDITSENINVKDEIPVAFESLKLNEQNEPAEKDNSEEIFYENEEVSQSQVSNSYATEINLNSSPVIAVTDPDLGNETAKEISYDQEFKHSNEIQMKSDVNVVPKEQTNLNTDTGTLEQTDSVIDQSDPFIGQTESAIEQTEPIIEQTEDPTYVAESIADFEAEQREMFYSEQADENYAHQQGEGATPYDYSQNEYPIDQEYVYGDQNAAALTTELNDELVTQKYDPIYEQQYTDVDQGAEHQQYTQQYEEPPNVTNKHDPTFETLQYEQEYETQGTIEQTLDMEDGYVGQPHDPQPDVEIEEETAETILAS
nr:uncharacterized protein LOC110373449 [Helicoverpa armigera]